MKWKLKQAKRKRRPSFHKAWLNSLNVSLNIQKILRKFVKWLKQARITGSTSVPPLSLSLFLLEQEQPNEKISALTNGELVTSLGEVAFFQEKICFRARGHGLLGHDRTISSFAWTFDPRHCAQPRPISFPVQTVKHRSVKEKKRKKKKERGKKRESKRSELNATLDTSFCLHVSGTIRAKVEILRCFGSLSRDLVCLYKLTETSWTTTKLLFAARLVLCSVGFPKREQNAREPLACTCEILLPESFRSSEIGLFQSGGHWHVVWYFD